MFGEGAGAGPALAAGRADDAAASGAAPGSGRFALGVPLATMLGPASTTALDVPIDGDGAGDAAISADGADDVVAEAVGAAAGLVVVPCR